MDKIIGIIANNNDLKQNIEELFPEDVKQGKIIIDILDSERIEEQGRLLEKKGAKAIIARSGGYRHTLGKVDVPVIQFKINTLDILYALKTASKFGKDLVLVISDLEYFNYEDWKDMINARVIIEKFDSLEAIEGRVVKYASSPLDVVIVGGGIPCGFAQELGLKYVPISASNESIIEIVMSARALIDSLYEQKYQNEMLTKTLDGVHDAVVAIDRESNIILYNERARETLKRDRQDLIGRNLAEVLPELGFMANVLKAKLSRTNEIINLKRIVIAANTSLLEVDGHVLGALCSFQDITKLQSLEKKIRYELNKKGLTAKYHFEDIIAYDPVMKDTVSKAIKIGLTDGTVMIYGESGTGKEMIAQSIHNISSRKNDPFVAINCAALTESLLESELFGYEEGAFTGARKGGKPGLFELAHGGTVFLDEINSVSPALQTKLLRVLEEKEVMRIGSDYIIPLDVRIISAANERLEMKIEEGSFRSDLFYRLSILELNVPPLRKRKLDIVPIFKHYLSTLTESSSLSINHELEERLKAYPWPGNVRELRNNAQRYVLFGELELDHKLPRNNAELKDGIIDLKEIDRYVEEKVIDMLAQEGLTKNEIAKLLGISRASLWNKTNKQSKEK
ncbi:sigma 54-interacting transcriptional regulator [Desulfitobacterium sp.]|uniref:sigma 54-interacting transcriptional regulator n=1 Tax=Desulfitobacterium sp. TaxID=49981 RepID=UPI002B21080D|nr:sigma 54-interacting transcriptional regulator [Desulfitobacterium sp.]MEA4902545.1 sigma 54-interacting transcriptional regulator [Desulfitobacterium sp.]